MKYIKQFKQWILMIIECRFFLYKRTFNYQPFLYIDESGGVASGEITSIIRWLDNTYSIKEYSLIRGMKIAKNKVSKIYTGDLDDVWYF